jgi:hypothetical protein
MASKTMEAMVRLVAAGESRRLGVQRELEVETFIY